MNWSFQLNLDLVSGIKIFINGNSIQIEKKNQN